MTKEKMAHTKWECTYHIVWIPKYRRKVLCGQVMDEMKKIIAQLCEMKGIEIVEGAVCWDHIHMCVKIPPKYSVSEVMGYLKGKSALRIWEKHPECNRSGHGKEFWARGYYVSTVGLNERVVKKYIAEQEYSDRIGDGL